jgi:hypothetical protein
LKGRLIVLDGAVAAVNCNVGDTVGGSVIHSNSVLAWRIWRVVLGSSTPATVTLSEVDVANQKVLMN